MAELRWNTMLSTATSTATAVPTATLAEPGSISDGARGILKTNGASSVRMAFFGTGADNTLATVFVYGWSSTFDDLWIPSRLVKMTVKIGTAVGVDGTSIENELVFCDQVVQTPGDGDDNVITISDAEGDIGSAIIDTRGSAYIEVGFDPTGFGSCTDINGIFGTL